MGAARFADLPRRTFQMAEAVVCPKCWSWDHTAKRANCRLCGTPLVPAIAGGATVYPMVGVSRSGVDWVDIAMFITIGYGLVILAVLIIMSIAMPNIKVPITNPSTGLTTVQTFNLGPIFAIAGVITAGFFLIFAWLTKYWIARIIFL